MSLQQCVRYWSKCIRQALKVLFKYFNMTAGLGLSHSMHSVQCFNNPHNTAVLDTLMVDYSHSLICCSPRMVHFH